MIFFLVLSALMIGNSFCCERRPDLTKKIKNGHIDVYLRNNSVQLIVRKIGKHTKDHLTIIYYKETQFFRWHRNEKYINNKKSKSLCG